MISKSTIKYYYYYKLLILKHINICASVRTFVITITEFRVSASMTENTLCNNYICILFFLRKTHVTNCYK